MLNNPSNRIPKRIIMINDITAAIIKRKRKITYLDKTRFMHCLLDCEHFLFETLSEEEKIRYLTDLEGN